MLYPHQQNTSINIDHYSVSLSFASGTANANIKLGIITAIGVAGCDISWLISDTLGAHSANDSRVISYNYEPSSVTFYQDTGVLQKAVTNDVSTALSAIKTTTPLPSSTGTSIQPVVGDVILSLGYVDDTFTAVVGVLYHSN